MTQPDDRGKLSLSPHPLLDTSIVMTRLVIDSITRGRFVFQNPPSILADDTFTSRHILPFLQQKFPKDYTELTQYLGLDQKDIVVHLENWNGEERLWEVIREFNPPYI